MASILESQAAFLQRGKSHGLSDAAPLGLHCGSMRCVVCGVGGWVSFVGRCVRYAGVRTSDLRCTASAASLLDLEQLNF